MSASSSSFTWEQEIDGYGKICRNADKNFVLVFSVIIDRRNLLIEIFFVKLFVIFRTIRATITKVPLQVKPFVVNLDVTLLGREQKIKSTFTSFYLLYIIDSHKDTLVEHQRNPSGSFLSVQLLQVSSFVRESDSSYTENFCYFINFTIRMF